MYIYIHHTAPGDHQEGERILKQRNYVHTYVYKRAYVYIYIYLYIHTYA
jgi:hypothetical protein